MILNFKTLNYRKKIYFDCLLLLTLILIPSLLAAQEIEINVRTRSEPKSALGIFFTSGKIVQQPSTSFERVSDDIVAVKMPYDIASLPSASPFATAYLLTADNEIVFGDIRLVSSADSSDSFWRIPLCTTDSAASKVQTPLSDQLSDLEALLQIRNRKREIAQKVIASKMTPELVARLQKLEKGFGLANEKSLSSDLSGLEIVERLSRLRDTIILYRSTKENNAEVSKPAPTPTSKAASYSWQ